MLIAADLPVASVTGEGTEREKERGGERERERV